MTRGDFLLVGILIGMGVLFNVASGSPAVVTSAGATGDKKHDILLISCWQKSSIINTQGIAEALAERGHRVRVVTPTEEQRYVTTHPRVQFVDGGAGPAADDPQYAISALTPDGGNWKKAHTIFHIWQGVGIYGLAMFRHLLDTLRADPPELILYDVLALAGPALARSLNITSVAVAPHITSFVRWGHFDWTVPTIISGHSRTTMNSLSSRLANGAQALLLNHVLPLLRAQIQRPYYQALGLPLDFADHQMLILGNSLATEYPSALPAHVFRVGPFLPRSFASPLPPALLQWIESPSSAASSSSLPIIYLAIGTNSYWTPALVNAFIAEFEQHAGHAYRVIWTFDPQRVESGGAQFASYFEQVATSPAVKVIDYVNQFALLGHPQVKLFITHCGLGSIHEALYQGTPMVCMPTMLESDQPTNAARLAELGLASWIDRRGGEPSAHHLHHVLLHALTTSSSWPTLQYQQYVRSLGGVARAADLVEQALDLHLPSLLFQ